MTSNGLVPLIRYRDVAAAVDWLSNAFGFEKRSVITDPDGTVAYAELSYGRGIVMLGPVGQSVLDSLMKQPDELGGIGTQSVYVAVDDVAAHFDRTRAAGAEIVLEFGSEEAGDRAYAARDPEGHVWNFGAYSPWPATPPPPIAAAAEPAYSGRPSRGQALLGGAVATLAIASLVGLSTLDPPKPVPRFAAAPAAPAPGPADAGEISALKETLARETHARQEAARTAAAIREELAREKAERVAAEAARQDLQRKLAATPPATPPPSVAAVPTAEPAEAKAMPPAPATAVTAAPPAPVSEPAATAAAASPEPPPTTGSLGTQPREAAVQPTAEEPSLPVSVGPATPQEKPEKAASQPAQAKPKPAVKPKPQAQKKTKPAPRKNSGNDPLFMYD